MTSHDERLLRRIRATNRRIEGCAARCQLALIGFGAALAIIALPLWLTAITAGAAALSTGEVVLK